MSDYDWIHNPFCWLAWVGPFVFIAIVMSFSGQRNAETDIVTVFLCGAAAGWFVRGLGNILKDPSTR